MINIKTFFGANEDAKKTIPGLHLFDLFLPSTHIYMQDKGCIKTMDAVDKSSIKIKKNSIRVMNPNAPSS